jgi:hypothetical protein
LKSRVKSSNTGESRTIEAKESVLKYQHQMISRLTGGDSYPYFSIENKTLK